MFRLCRLLLLVLFPIGGIGLELPVTSSPPVLQEHPSADGGPDDVVPEQQVEGVQIMAPVEASQPVLAIDCRPAPADNPIGLLAECTSRPERP